MPAQTKIAFKHISQYSRPDSDQNWYKHMYFHVIFAESRQNWIEIVLIVVVMCFRLMIIRPFQQLWADASVLFNAEGSRQDVKKKSDGETILEDCPSLWAEAPQKFN